MANSTKMADPASTFDNIKSQLRLSIFADTFDANEVFTNGKRRNGSARGCVSRQRLGIALGRRVGEQRRSALTQFR